MHRRARPQDVAETGLKRRGPPQLHIGALERARGRLPWSLRGAQADVRPSSHLAVLVFLTLSLMLLIFLLADYVLYNRAFGNPLLVFCIACSLVSYLVAAIFPNESSVSKPFFVAGLATWSLMVFRILAYEWDPRIVGSYQEPMVRTMLRRFVLITWSSLTFFITFAYVSELVLRSTWGTIRAQFTFAASTDLFHTAVIHILYYVDPDSQPKVPIAHTSGVRVGPPTFGSYAPCLYLLIVAFSLTPGTRAWLSRFTGGSKLSIALGEEVHAGELAELPAPPGDSDDGKSILSFNDKVRSLQKKLRNLQDSRRMARSSYDDELRSLQQQLRNLEEATFMRYIFLRMMRRICRVGAALDECVHRVLGEPKVHRPLKPTHARVLPRAASSRFAIRIFFALVVILLLLLLADYVLYNRAFGNPLLVFCIACSLTAFLLAAIFPDDGSISKSVFVAGMVTWSLIALRILIYEWDPRIVGSYQEPMVRTMLRRFVLITWSSLTFFITFAYVSELVLRSTWGTIRAQFTFAASTDLFHTAVIHILYYVDPDSQPKVPIAHTSGVRVGPPTFGSYAPCLYILIVAFSLTPGMRAWLSRLTGGSKLSITLGQVRAGELAELPAPPGESGEHGGEGSWSYYYTESTSSRSSSDYGISSAQFVGGRARALPLRKREAICEADMAVQ